nr:RNA-directed DNA polymerase, eukaryota, reverse transcriptase zinc-binding domain protein [Tanacetum cinerariifolium]
DIASLKWEEYSGVTLSSVVSQFIVIWFAPMRVLKELESVRKQFFNGHDPKSKKASWVKWSTVTSAKDQGGLGVASLYAPNRALMLKWMWRFFANQDSLWTSDIC